MAVLPILLESYRDIEELMAQRGVRVSYETIRQWCLKFGQTIAAELRRRRPRPGDKWHLDEVYLKINGRTHYLWQAPSIRRALCSTSFYRVGATSSRRKGSWGDCSKRDAIRPSHHIVTDKLKSYGVAITES
jgi:putative transposase